MPGSGKRNLIASSQAVAKSNVIVPVPDMGGGKRNVIVPMPGSG